MINKLTKILTFINDIIAFIFSKIIPDFFKEIWDFISFSAIPKISQHNPIKIKVKKKKFRSKKNKNTYSKSFYMGGVFFAVIMFFSGSYIYHNAKKIVRGLEKQKRDIANIGVSHRAAYYGVEKNHITLSIIEIPIIHRRGERGVGSVKIEFTLETSNTYLRNYILEHEYEFRDQIISTLELISTPYIFTKEGIEVMKMKIEVELNIYIEEKNIDGRIQKVSIGNIISG